jgi:hypothetical protein
MEESEMTELEMLKAKLAARKGKEGYKENVREIEARIAELEKTNDQNG